jgi:hypothetical protein
MTRPATLGRPGLEALEGRLCPASLTLQGHTLLLTGGNADNAVVIRDNGQGTVTASITEAGHKHSITAHGVQSIQVHDGNGHDSIDYALTGQLKTSEQIALHLGGGTDQVKLNFGAGVSAPVLGVQLDGGKGSDLVDAVFGAVANTQLTFNANLGTAAWPGSDQFTAHFNGDLTGKANVHLNVQDGNGYDGLAVKINGNIGAAAQMDVELHGGSLPDTIHADYQGQLNGQLTIRADGGPGGDWIASDVNIAAGSKGRLTDHLTGGPGDDLLLLQVHDHSHHLQTLDALVAGGGGSDQGVITPNVKAVAVALN